MIASVMIVLIAGAGSFFGLITVNAAAPDFDVITEEYSDTSKSYIPISQTTPSNVVRVVVKRITPLTNLGGIRFKLTYNKNIMECQTYASTCFIQDAKGLMSFTDNAEKGEIIISWDTTAINTNASGDLFAISFVVKETAETSAAFDLTILDLYDSNYNNISSVKTARATVAISKISFTEATLNIFRALSTIVYPTSLNAIVTAENTFAEFSAAQISALRDSYPVLYENFVSARNKYNELAGNAVMEKIIQEAALFRTTNARVLSLDTATVKIEDDADIKKAGTMLETMSPQAKALISQQEKDLIKALSDKTSQLKKAEADRLSALSDANDFINSYQNIWNLSDTSIKSSYDSLAPIISEALVYYNSMLSPEARAYVTEQKAYLDAAQAIINAILANNEAERKTMEKVTAFQLRWVKLFSLNAATVSIADETALKLMLDDLNAQEAAVREKLLSRKTFSENLLQTIDSKKAQLPVVPDVTNPNESGNSNINNDTPDVIGNNNDGNGNNNENNNNSGDSVNDNEGNNIGGSNNENSDNTVIKDDKAPAAVSPIVLIRDIPLIIKALSLMLAGAIILMIYVAFIYMKMLRRDGFIMKNGRLGETL